MKTPKNKPLSAASQSNPRQPSTAAAPGLEVRDSADLVATHKGWFLFCPVFVDMTDANVPGVWARWNVLEPLLTLAHWVQLAMMSVLSLIDSDYEPAWMIHITGQARTGAAL